MVNPDVDGYAETLNHRKITVKRKKQQSTENQTNTNTEISLNWGGGPVFTLNCQGGNFAPLLSVIYVTAYDTLFLHAVSCPYSSATRYEMVA